MDNSQPIFIAQEIMKQSGVPHVLVYRKAAQGGSSYDWNVPNYSLPPDQAAEIHWQMHRDAFPPELDRSLVWLEMINAVDKNAAQWLGQLGFEKASMSEICARVGGSKATLYNYFASKDELFFETMDHLCKAELEAVHQSIDLATDNITEALRHFGERFLGFLYAPTVMAYRHLSIAESGRTELGRLLYERGVMPSQKLVTDFLEAAMAQGRLRQADPALATKHWYALIESELIDRFLFKLTVAIDDAEIKAATARALEVFMAAYGPQVQAGLAGEGRR